MIALMQVKTKNDKSFSHFDFIAEEKDLNAIFKEKHNKKYLAMISKNDLILGRTTIFAVNYGDKDKFAQFSLLPGGA